MSMPLLKPPFLVSHPILSGLIFAALFVPMTLLMNAIGGVIVENPISLIISAVPVGIAWGYCMSWWLKRESIDDG
ncbi:MAG: hypothetical protein J0I69_06020 [Altererythrobacter sp.]|nr:hypothetical protein [Altererythrobacter sp.]